MRRKHKLSTASACAVAVCTALPASAQQPETPEDLGSVTVEAAPTVPTAPPPTNFPPAGNTAEPLGPFDAALSYPSLSQQEFGGLGSLTRTDRSVFDSPQFVTILDRQSIQQKNPIDMFQALQNEVGVLVQRTGKGQASPFIRGFTGQQIVVMMDGIRLNTSVLRSGPNQYFNLIDPGMIERIEISRGAGSVAWGSDALGGAINVVSRSPDPNREYGRGAGQTIFSTADLASYTRFSGEGWSGPVGVYGGASYLNVNDLDTGGSNGRQPFTDYDQYAADVKFVTQLTDDAVLSVALQHFEQRDVPRSDRFLPFVAGPPTNLQRPTIFDVQQRDLVGITLQGLSDSSLFDAYWVVGSYQYNKEVDTQDRYTGTAPVGTFQRTEKSEFDLDTWGISAAFSKDLGGLGVLTYGADWYHDDVNSSRFNATTGANVVAQFPNDAIYQRMGAFALLDTDLTDRLHMQTGLRYENADLSGTIAYTNPNALIYTDRTYQDWVASVGFVYELTEEANLVGGIYEGYRAPNLSDVASNNTFQQSQISAPTQQGANIGPEHTVTYEVGLKYDGPLFRMQLMEYWVGATDLIGSANVGGVNTAINIPNAYINGTELNAEYLLTDEWSAYGNFWYTYGQNKFLNEPLSRMSPTQGILGLRWQDERRRSYFDVYAWLVNRQDRYATANKSDARFPVGGTAGYATLNLRTGTTFGERDNQQVSLVLENITNQPYRVLGSGVDGTGFNAILGYQFVR